LPLLKGNLQKFLSRKS